MEGVLGVITTATFCGVKDSLYIFNFREQSHSIFKSSPNDFARLQKHD